MSTVTQQSGNSRERHHVTKKQELNRGDRINFDGAGSGEK